MAAEKPYFPVCPIPGNLEAKQFSIEEYVSYRFFTFENIHDIFFSTANVHD